jgi:hypothetical protein
MIHAVRGGEKMGRRPPDHQPEHLDKRSLLLYYSTDITGVLRPYTLSGKENVRHTLVHRGLTDRGKIDTRKRLASAHIIQRIFAWRDRRKSRVI